MLPIFVECFDLVFKAQLDELKHTNVPSQSTKRKHDKVELVDCIEWESL